MKGIGSGVFFDNLWPKHTRAGDVLSKDPRVGASSIASSRMDKNYAVELAKTQFTQPYWTFPILNFPTLVIVYNF